MLRILACVATVLVLTGCGLFGKDGPSEVRLSIDGPSGTRATLVTTSNFIAQIQPIFSDDGIYLRDTTMVEVLSADTNQIALPFSGTYDIEFSQRFLSRVLLISPEPGMRVRAWVDNENRMDRVTSIDTLVQFMYFFLNSDIPLDEPVEL